MDSENLTTEYLKMRIRLKSLIKDQDLCFGDYDSLYFGVKAILDE